MARRRQPTAFEERVYAVVRQIPRGQTRSYQWVAKQLGNPRAARAVGNALHRNPYASEVPCHRVICCDGSLGGFAKGVARKRALLNREGAVLSGGRKEAANRRRDPAPGMGTEALVERRPGRGSSGQR